MSAKGKEIDREDLPVEEEEISTHQEATPVPWLCGTRRLSLRWITPAFALATQAAPDEVSGKK